MEHAIELLPTDPQTIFNRVVIGLFNQGRQSRNDSVVCRYRSDNGLKCAVGLLIPDELYTPNFEGNGVRILIDDYFLEWFPVRNLITHLQHTHDQSSTDENGAWNKVWEDCGIAKKLTKTAQYYKLKPDVVYQCWRPTDRYAY